MTFKSFVHQCQVLIRKLYRGTFESKGKILVIDN